MEGQKGCTAGPHMRRRRDHSCDGCDSVVEYVYAIAIDSSISLFMLFTACLVIMYGKVKVE